MVFYRYYIYHLSFSNCYISVLALGSNSALKVTCCPKQRSQERANWVIFFLLVALDPSWSLFQSARVISLRRIEGRWGILRGRERNTIIVLDFWRLWPESFRRFSEDKTLNPFEKTKCEVVDGCVEAPILILPLEGKFNNCQIWNISRYFSHINTIL